MSYFHLQPAPVEDYVSGSPGVVSYRSARPGFGTRYAGAEKVDLKSFVTRISQVRGNDNTVKILSGGGRFSTMDREYLDLTVDIDNIDGDSWQALRRLYEMRRTVMFTPWYDASTFWMSTFGALEDGGGFAVVGDNASTQWTRRLSTAESIRAQHAPHDAWVQVTGNNAKLVRGYTGRAILINRASQGMTAISPSMNPLSATQYATPAYGIIEGGGVGRRFHCYYNASIPQGGTISVTGLTNGVTYTLTFVVATTALSGEGVQARVVHNSGSTTVNGSLAASSDAESSFGVRQYSTCSVTWTQVGTTASAQLVHPGLGPTALDFHFAGMQLETGTGLTCLTGAATATNPDRLLIADTPTPTGGITFALIYKYINNAAPKYFFSWVEASTNMGAYLANNTYNVFVDGNGPSDQLSVSAGAGLTSESWVHLVITVSAIPSINSGRRVTLYQNGVALGTKDTTNISFAKFWNWSNFYVGSSAAHGSGNGLDTPLDRFRIDQRAWSDTEVLEDYNRFADEGVRALLTKTDGRLYRIAAMPQGFRVPITEDVVGQLQLEQVGYIQAGLAR